MVSHSPNPEPQVGVTERSDPFRGLWDKSLFKATYPRTLQMYTEASRLNTQLGQKEPNSFFQKKEHLCVPYPIPSFSQSCTSVGMLGTEPVKPFSAMVLWELLGELGPEPGALLHTDDTTGEVAVTWACFEPPLLPDLHN